MATNPTKVPVTFCWARGGSAVSLVGSWNEWKETPMEGEGGVFSLHVDIPEGDYFYHYVVDSKRIIDKNQPAKEVEGHGKVNCIRVKENPKPKNQQ